MIAYHRWYHPRGRPGSGNPATSQARDRRWQPPEAMDYRWAPPVGADSSLQKLRRLARIQQRSSVVRDLHRIADALEALAGTRAAS